MTKREEIEYELHTLGDKYCLCYREMKDIERRKSELLKLLEEE